ncbi:MAG TPA: hypothetical protein VMD29_05470 [Terracidiphilus sp.]|nr:hypothetical protein [Terracidiphilus sp.]
MIVFTFLVFWRVENQSHSVETASIPEPVPFPVGQSSQSTDKRGFILGLGTHALTP